MTIDAIIHECEHISDELDYENTNGRMDYSTYSDLKDSIGKIQKWLEKTQFNKPIMKKQLINSAGNLIAECYVGCDLSNQKDFTGFSGGEVWFPDCDSAVKTSMGSCNGYCHGDNDDEPIDQCKACKKHVGYGDDEGSEL